MVERSPTRRAALLFLNGDPPSWFPDTDRVRRFDRGWWFDVLFFGLLNAAAVGLIAAASAIGSTAIAVGATVVCVAGLAAYTFGFGLALDDWEDDFTGTNRVLLVALPAAIVVPTIAFVILTLR